MNLAGPSRAARLATVLAVVIAGLALVAVVLSVIQPDQHGLAAAVLANLAAGFSIGPIGALIVRRRGNAVGWVLLGIGFCLAVQGLAVQYAIVAATGRLDLPSWQWVLTIGFVVWALFPGVAGLLFLLFPTGALLSRRWRAVLWLDVGAWTGLAVISVLNPGQSTINESSAVNFDNPAGIEALRGLISVLQPVLGVASGGAVFLAVGSLVVRFRRARPDEREQIKWLAYVGGLALLFLPIEFLLAALSGSDELSDAGFYVFYAAASLGMPAAIGAAILRHGLYDIEVVIRKTVIVAALATFFVVVYVLMVGGVGALISGATNAELSFAAAAVVAALFQPGLAQARRFANLVVYGRRATPYEVLSQFSGVMAETRSHDAVLEEMARVVGEGAGARRAGVWLRLGRSLQLSASWPDAGPSAGRAEIPLAGGGLPELPADVAAGVRQDGELLGALTVVMPAAEPATDATRTLVADLAGQAGLVLRNVQLIAELRASRRRLVTAGDNERRRLERDLHDGAQQQLIGLRLRLRLAEAALDDPSLMKSTLEELGDVAQAALDDLRSLAHGIYPPLLADRGLVTALESQARRSALAVTVDADAIGRYPQETEAAVYFCSLEALQNVAKYAGASSATVRLWQDGGWLCFAVTDDGAGFDPASTGYGSGLQGMADRLSALGGSLSVSSEPGAGMTVGGRLPS